MKTISKFLTIIAVLLVVVVLVAWGSVEGLYHYQIHKTDPVKQLSEVNYPRQLHEVEWVLENSTGEMVMKPLSATNFLYQTWTADASEEGTWFGGWPIAYSLAKMLTREKSSPENKQSESELELEEALLSMWITKNYSMTEAMDALLDRKYFGSDIYGADNAAESFYDKAVNELNLSENIMMSLFSKLPDVVTPCVDEADLMLGGEKLLGWLKQGFPEKYGEATFEVPAFSEAMVEKCQ